MEVRIKLNKSKTIVVHTVGPAPPSPQAAPGTTSIPQASQPPETSVAIASQDLQPTVAPMFTTTAPLRYKPVIAIVEAVACDAHLLARTTADVLEATSMHCGLLSLDGQNRLAASYGQTVAAPLWCWKQGAAELLLADGLRMIVPGPALPDEPELAGSDVQRVLQRLHDATQGIVVDLGCRWQPRIFQPVLRLATHIWIVAPANKWTGMEMRLEQAELSGWTDMSRVRLLALGDHVMSNRPAIRAVAIGPDCSGSLARNFVINELGRGA